MKTRLALRIGLTLCMFLACGLMAFAQVEIGWTDFPFTASDGNVIGASYSGTAVNYTTAYTNCGVTTKANSVWLGSSGTGVMTNTFSSAVTSVTYRLTATNQGEVLTVTTNAGTPTITLTGGSCGSNWSVSGNVLTDISSAVSGAEVTISSSTPFTSITLSHNGNGSGTLFTMIYGGAASAIPVSPWTIAILFLVIGTAGYMILRKTAATNASPA
jgi:hypothetical protein